MYKAILASIFAYTAGVASGEWFEMKRSIQEANPDATELNILSLMWHEGAYREMLVLLKPELIIFVLIIGAFSLLWSLAGSLGKRTT